MAGPVGEVGIPPKHYKTESGIQPFDVIDEYDLGFYLGNAFKYIIRAHQKGDFLGDIGKAMHYIREAVLRLPHNDASWEWEPVPWVDETLHPDIVTGAFDLDDARTRAVNAILEAAQSEDSEMVEYLLDLAIEALTGALIFHKSLT